MAEPKSSHLATWFALSERGSTVGDEIRAGTRLFWTFGYSIVLVSQILHQLPLFQDRSVLASFDTVFLSACLLSAFATALAGIFGNLPVAIGPSVGCAAFLALGLGPDGASYEEALSFSLIAGIVLLLFATFQVYSYIAMRILPEPVKWSLVASQGLLVALIGVLWLGGGVFFSVPHSAGQISPPIESTTKSLSGAGSLENIGPLHWSSSNSDVFHHRAQLPYPSDVMCTINKQKTCAKSAAALLGREVTGFDHVHAPISSQGLVGLAGLALTAALQILDQPGGVVIGVTSVSLLVWGMEGFQSFTAPWLIDFSTVASWQQVPQHVIAVAQLPGVLGWSSILPVTAIVTLCVVETWGAVVGLFNIGELAYLGLHTSIRSQSGSRAKFWLLMSSVLGTIGAGLLGCSPVVVRLESAVGIAEGGRTGICAIASATWMFLFALITPLIRQVPLAAIAPVAIMVGASTLFSALRFVHWESALHFLPAFVILMTTVLSARVDLALALGLALYMMLALVATKCCFDRSRLGSLVAGSNGEDSAAAFFGVPVNQSEYTYESDLDDFQETDRLLGAKQQQYKSEYGTTSNSKIETGEFEI